jgi:hypothetical protein
MQDVAAEGEVPEKGTYLVRVSEVVETDKDGNPLLSAKGEPKIIVKSKIQDEGKFFGHTIAQHVSLQPHALRGLKAIYTACGYMPGPEGHDPQQILDSTFYVYGEPQDLDTDNGTIKTFNIAPWNIKSVQDGPPKVSS